MIARHIVSIVGVATAVFSLAQFANADSLQIYCNEFDDIWFTTMTFANGYCYPGTWGDITVTRADAVFGASLNVGLIGESEFIEQMDEQFKTDFSGRNMPFPVNRDIGDTHEEFDVASFGSFATRKSLNTWQVVFDNNGKELGHRQDVSITYIIRQGRCYATLGVSGEGPLDSPFYYGILSDNAKKEVGVVTNTMKNMGICGGSSDTPSGIEMGLIPSPILKSAGEEEKTISLQPVVEEKSEIPAQTSAPSSQSSNQIHIIEIKECFAPLKSLDGKSGCSIDLGEIFKEPSGLINAVIPEKIDPEGFIIDEDVMSEYQAKFKTYSRLAEEVEHALQKSSETISAVSSEIRIPSASYDSYQSLIVLDAEGYAGYVTVGGEAVENITKNLELPSQSAIITGDDGKVVVGEKTDKTVMEINPRSIIVVAGWSAVDTSSAPKDFVSRLANFPDTTVRSGSVTVTKTGDGPDMKVNTPLTTTVSEHTRFKVVYDPEEQFAITTIYEGEVKVTDNSGRVTVLTPREDGKPRALVALGEKSDEKNFLPSFSWIFLAVCFFAGIGFAVWRKMQHK